MVYRIALTHTRCREDADDVFQEVFLTYHRKRPELADEGHLQAWLITTAMNCARRLIVAPWRDRSVLADEEGLAREERQSPRLLMRAASASEAQFGFGTEEQDELFAALQRLPEEYRNVVHLFYFDDLPVKRIAEMLGEEPGCVKVRLSRARARLREHMEKRGRRTASSQPCFL
jgi:RNA polymerase sigma-70 factor (ECF subfamily)